MLHELGHVIGLEHEQCRTDRENYVNIHYNNIDPNFTRPFDIRQNISSFGVPYDYRSLMHYGKDDFAIEPGLITIETLDPDYQDVIGAGKRLTNLDLLTIDRMYGCERKSDFFYLLAKRLYKRVFSLVGRYVGW